MPTCEQSVTGASSSGLAGTATPSSSVSSPVTVWPNTSTLDADLVKYAAGRTSVPTSNPIVGAPATVTGAEKVTLTSIRSPSR